RHSFDNRRTLPPFPTRRSSDLPQRLTTPDEPPTARPHRRRFVPDRGARRGRRRDRGGPAGERGAPADRALPRGREAPGGAPHAQIGRAHAWTPVTDPTRLPSSP